MSDIAGIQPPPSAIDFLRTRSLTNVVQADEVADKFRGCAAFARFPKDRAETVVGMVRDLESLDSIERLTSALMQQRP